MLYCKVHFYAIDLLQFGYIESALQIIMSIGAPKDCIAIRADTTDSKLRLFARKWGRASTDARFITEAHASSLCSVFSPRA